MRILHCLRAPVGGLFRHVRDLAIEQAARGHEVGVLCDAASADSMTESRLAAIAGSLALGVHRAPMSRDLGLRDVTAVRAVRRLARDLAIDVLHGHGAKGGAYARLAPGRIVGAGGERRIARIYTPHGGSLHYHPRSPKGAVFMALERALMARSEALIFESAYSQSRYVAQVGASRCLSRVIGNGLRPDEFRPHEPGADATDIVFIGELRTLKGVDVLLEALADLNRPVGGAAGAVSATIVGEGPDGDAFHRQATALGLEALVTFTGARPASEMFDRGRCIVVPSRAESLPYIVLEAAARAMPMIATDVGGIPEIVAGTDTALIPAGDAAALARAIAAVIADPQTARARAGRLRDTVSSRYNIDAMTSAIVGLYEDALAT